MEFFSRYGDSELLDIESSCVVSEDMLYLVEYDKLRFSVVVQRGLTTSLFDYELTVIGTLSGDISGVIFCSDSTCEDIYALSGENYQYKGIETAFHNYSSTDIRLFSDDTSVGTLIAYDEFQIDKYYEISAAYRLWNKEYYETILLYDQYDKSIFGTDERVCAVSEDILETARDGILRFDVLSEEDGVVLPIDAEWTIIGIITGEGAGQGMVYIPALSALSLEIPMTPFIGDWSTSTVWVSILLEPEVPVLGLVSGVSSLERYNDHALAGRAITSFYEGYDDSVFQSNELVCVISEDMSDRVVDGHISLNVVSKGIAGATPIDVELKIAGTISGSEERSVYIPFQTAGELGQEEVGGPQYTELIHARLIDNRTLDEFKEIASRTFTRVGVFFNPQVFAMIIYDAEFYDMTEAFMQTIFFIDIATPFVYVIAVCVGFVASFLLTRRRAGEFAVMRSVGVDKMCIFFGTLLEQTLLCAVGAALGCVLFKLTWEHVFIERALIFLGCYMLGAAVSATRAARTDVLRLLRDKE